MGYRALLARYIRFVEAKAGDHFIDSIAYDAEPPFSDRELRELRALVDEICRSSDDVPPLGRMPSPNYRMRHLCMCFGLTLQQAAEVAGTDPQTVRRWRTNPRSRHYLPMTEDDSLRFELSLFQWLTCLRNGGLPCNSDGIPSSD